MGIKFEKHWAFSVKDSRQTTYTSLRAVVGLLLCDNKEQFDYYYKLATHDNSGDTCWHYMQSMDDENAMKKRSEYMRAYNKAYREKQKKRERGENNVI